MTPDPVSGELQLADIQELRLLFGLRHEIERVGSFDRLMHVAVRILAPYFGATQAVVLAPERAAGLRTVAQLGTRTWDLEVARQILGAGRAAVPPEILYAPLRERGKAVALLLLARGTAFARSELRVLQRAAEIISDRLEDLGEERVVEVLARIDVKISRELRTVDLLYQILDGLELLTRYDHSGAILLFDRERSRLEVSAEKIVWRKMKSPHIHQLLPLERDLAEMLGHENRGFRLRRGAAAETSSGAGAASGTTAAPTRPNRPPRRPCLRTSIDPLCEVYRDDIQLLSAPPERVVTLFELLSYGSIEGAPQESSMLLVPLLFGPRLLGLLKLSAVQPDAFTQHDVYVVGRFIEKMSTSIRNANLYGRRLAELRAINDIGKLVTRALPLEETCASILDIVLRVLNLTDGSIELLDRDGDQLRVLASRGFGAPGVGMRLGEGITGTVAQTGEPIVANDVHKHAKYVMRSPEVRSELAVPIRFEGMTIGVLNVESHASDRFSERELDFVCILADKTATALETLEQREHRRATLQLLHELGAALIAPEELGKLLQVTVDLTRRHLSCEVATIFLFETGRFRRRATSGLPDDWFPTESYATGEGLTGSAVVPDETSPQRGVVVNDLAASPDLQQDAAHRYAEKLPSGRLAHLIAVPLVEGDRPIGILRAVNRLMRDGRIVSGGFNPQDVTLLTTIASQVSLAIANFKKRQRIQQMSVKLESQVRQRTEEVHRLASFVENAPLAILEVDPQGVLRFINEAGERMFGYQAAELRDRRLTGEGLGLLGDAFGDLVRVVEFMGFWAGEITYKRSDGKTAPAFLSARAMREPGGDMRGVIVFARDITKTKELELQLLEAEGKRAMADLAGGVAHDLNNALGATLPMIQALEADLEEGHFDRDTFISDLKQIESYTRLSVRIFQGMLSMARGTFALDKLVNVNERAETALDLLSLRLQKSKVKVRLELQKDLPLTMAHPARLEQVFHNLIHNAIEAMPDGGTLTVRTRSDGRNIVLEVEDTGRGIPEDMLVRVQEPFYTSKSHGTGLGLSVVRSIAWEHNGNMTMCSKVNEGTVVRIEIPVRTSLEAPTEDED
jgi:PAS domain S-box-containing protein